MSLFEPIEVGRFSLSHRLVLAPLTRSRGTERTSTGAESVANGLMGTYYFQRATKGGLLISEATPICPEGRFSARTPSLYSIEHVHAWKQVTDAVHDKGSIFFAQLWHLGMHCRPHLDPLSRPPPAPSAFLRPLDNLQTRALSINEIKEVIQTYASAAKNAILAGFDGVEIHAANGYLPDQFLNSNINTRTDAYGGSVENRCRFVLELAQAVVDAIGADRVGIRFSPFNKFGGMDDADPVETWSCMLKLLEPFELAYVHLVEPRVAGAGDALVPVDPSKVNLDVFRNVWKGVLIVAGGYTPETAANAVESKRADLVAFGRHFISTPDLVDRVRRGLPLNPYDRPTFQVGEEKGYIDYPTWEEKEQGKL
ncbi:hypothetical protein HDU79_010377 [Rhizoclosmatium sp. JEL0117]|nr:hypothetical protein HDU79_010377 [Rhizoclosmatium sp. JEL0117]